MWEVLEKPKTRLYYLLSCFSSIHAIIFPWKIVQRRFHKRHSMSDYSLWYLFMYICEMLILECILNGIFDERYCWNLTTWPWLFSFASPLPLFTLIWVHLNLFAYHVEHVLDWLCFVVVFLFSFVMAPIVIYICIVEVVDWGLTYLLIIRLIYLFIDQLIGLIFNC